MVPLATGGGGMEWERRVAVDMIWAPDLARHHAIHRGTSVADQPARAKTSPDDIVLYASDLDGFLYCERSWWYRMQGEASTRTAELERGTQQHEALARNVRAADRLAAAARLLIWVSIALLVALLAAQFLLGG